LPPFQSDAVLHYGQHVAMVVAETREEANAAAALIDVTYERDTPVLSYNDPRASRVSHPWTPDFDRGDAPRAIATADVQVRQTYATACNTNNPIGLFATVAEWDGDALTVHDTTQHPHGVRDTLATMFGIDPAGVRVLEPFVGGAFGAGLRAWPHVVLAALARGHEAACEACADACPDVHQRRPPTQHHSGDGTGRHSRRPAHGPSNIVATSSLGMADEMINLITYGTLHAYACPNLIDSRNPDSPEHSDPWLDACTWRSRRLVRPWSRRSTSSPTP
jgi:xanthine dehydrogenase YagR molybdenum-binding subunit